MEHTGTTSRGCAARTADTSTRADLPIEDHVGRARDPTPHARGARETRARHTNKVHAPQRAQYKRPRFLGTARAERESGRLHRPHGANRSMRHALATQKHTARPPTIRKHMRRGHIKRAATPSDAHALSPSGPDSISPPQRMRPHKHTRDKPPRRAALRSVLKPPPSPVTHPIHGPPTPTQHVASARRAAVHMLQALVASAAGTRASVRTAPHTLYKHSIR